MRRAAFVHLAVALASCGNPRVTSDAVESARLPAQGVAWTSAGQGEAEQPRTGELAEDSPVLLRARPETPLSLRRAVRVERWQMRDHARIVVHLDGPAPFRVTEEVGATGAWFVVELAGVTPTFVERALPSKGVLSQIRFEQLPSALRLRLAHTGKIAHQVFELPEPHRVVVDISRDREGTRARRVVARVALDPGHGGIDPGAVGMAGLHEKDVALDIAHRVAPVLAMDGLAVTLTRDKDVFVGLDERTARANAFNADLFVSIHCNASDSRELAGVETYVLDTTRDELTRVVAARENATSVAATRELSEILANMRMADQSTRSAHFAVLLQRSAMSSVRLESTDVHDGGVKHAAFSVLVGARMPSVLFETSYISHPREEQRLSAAAYRQRLADAIINAIRAYRDGR